MQTFPFKGAIVAIDDEIKRSEWLKLFSIPNNIFQFVYLKEVNLYKMRQIKIVHKAVYEPIDDLETYRAVPTDTLAMNTLDPFIFLNHHGRQEYKPNNKGLPFGPHPHRGFETVTFILEGDLTHKDSSGGSSTIHAGGVQWMTAGSGLTHAEISSDDFKANGGPLELLQLWLNLPKKYKMTPPRYQGLQNKEIPVKAYDEGKVKANIIAGEWDDVKGPVKTLTDIHLSLLEVSEGAHVTFTIPKGQNIFLYVVSGEIKVNGSEVKMHHLPEFDHSGETVEIKGLKEAKLIFGYATPYQEPFFAYGPFVMNTKEEIQEAYDDYKKGRFNDFQL